MTSPRMIPRSALAAFRQEVEKLGWTDGGNVRIDYRWAVGI